MAVSRMAGMFQQERRMNRWWSVEYEKETYSGILRIP